MRLQIDRLAHAHACVRAHAHALIEHRIQANEHMRPKIAGNMIAAKSSSENDNYMTL